MKQFKKLSAFALACALATTSMTGLAAPTEVYGASNAVTVSTQKQLDKALKDKKVKKITVKTKSKKSLSIKKGSYTAKTLVIQGAKLTIKNAGKFKAIKVADAASYKEAAKNNSITVTDSKLTLTVDQSATVAGLTFAKANAKNTVKVNGTVKKIDVTKKTDLTLSGSTSKAVVVNAKAADSKVTSSVKVTVNASKDVAVKLNKGAEASKVNVTSKNATVDVKNNTTKDVAVKKADGTTEKVKKGASLEIGNTASSDTDKKDEDKKEDEDKKDENEKKDETAGGGSISGGSYGGNVGGNPSGGSSAPSAATVFQNAIADTESNGTATLSETITGNVTATWAGIGEITIDLKAYTISGNFSLNAPDATTITIKDSGADIAGARIGSLTINAPKAHVENQATVSGNVDIIAVANNTFDVYDSVNGKLNMKGKGKIKVQPTVPNKPEVVIQTKEPVALEGSVEKVAVENAAAEISIADGTTVQDVEVKSGSSDAGVKISGKGKITNLKAAAKTAIDVLVTEVVAQAPIEVKKAIENVVVASNNAVVNVANAIKIENLSVAGAVSEVTIEGAGTVASVDVNNSSAAEVTVSTTSESVSVTTIVANDAAKIKTAGAINATVKAVSGVAVTAQPTKMLYFVGQKFSISGAKITVTYTDESTKEVSVTESMIKSSGIKENEAGTYQVVLTYAGNDVTIDNIQYQADTVSSIAVAQVEGQPYTEEYLVGETFACDAVIEVTYASGKKTYINEGYDAAVTTENIYADNKFTVTQADAVATVTYEGKTATYKFTVKAKDEVTYSISETARKTRMTNGDGKTFDVLIIDKDKDNGETTFQEWFKPQSKLNMNIKYLYRDRTKEDTVASATFPTEKGYYSVYVYTEDSGLNVGNGTWVWLDIIDEFETAVDQITLTAPKNTEDYTWNAATRTLTVTNSDKFFTEEELCSIFNAKSKYNFDVHTYYFVQGSENNSDLTNNKTPQKIGWYVVCFYTNKPYQNTQDIYIEYADAKMPHFTIRTSGKVMANLVTESIVQEKGEANTYTFVDMNGAEISDLNLVYFNADFSEKLPSAPTEVGTYWIKVKLDEINYTGSDFDGPGIYSEVWARIKLKIVDQFSQDDLMNMRDEVTLTGQDSTTDKYTYTAEGNYLSISGSVILTKEELIDIVKPKSALGFTENDDFKVKYYVQGTPTQNDYSCGDGMPTKPGNYVLFLVTTYDCLKTDIFISYKDYPYVTQFTVTTSGAVTYTAPCPEENLGAKMEITQGEKFSFEIKDEYGRQIPPERIYYANINGEEQPLTNTMPWGDGVSSFDILFYVEACSSGYPLEAWHRISVTVNSSSS